MQGSCNQVKLDDLKSDKAEARYDWTICMVDPLNIIGMLWCRRTAHVMDIAISSREQLFGMELLVGYLLQIQQYTPNTQYRWNEAHEICARGQFPYGIVPREQWRLA
jgi:hypothetical protein